MGALSPRTRNAQVALFQSGEVDYLVATDAVGMGLNLDVDHVAFASLRKFDGQRARALDAAEIGQIAGRAGRFLRDGTFGTVLPLELERDVAQRVEGHRFDSVTRVRYRNSELDFASPASLLDSLRAPPPLACLSSVPAAEDLRSLEALLRDPGISKLITDPARVELLWQVCQIPDFRRILFEVHVDLLRLIFNELVHGPLSTDFVLQRARELDRSDGDADALMARIANLRTWAFVANQGSWVRHAGELVPELARIEDRLSDALHHALVARFVERSARTRVKTARAAGGRGREPFVEAPRDDAFRPFMALENLRLRLAPESAAKESVTSRLDSLFEAPHEAFELDSKGYISAEGTRLGRITRGTSVSLPEVRVLDLPEVGGAARLRLQRRLLAYARDVVTRLLGPVRELNGSEAAPLRAVAHELERGLGSALSRDLSPSLNVLTSEHRRELTRAGIVVGRLCVYAKASASGANRERRAALMRAFEPDLALPEPLGKPSYEAAHISSKSWLALGYVTLGPRAVRADLAERAAAALLADQDPYRMLSSFGVPRARLSRTLDALHSLLADDVDGHAELD